MLSGSPPIPTLANIFFGKLLDSTLSSHQWWELRIWELENSQCAKIPWWFSLQSLWPSQPSCLLGAWSYRTLYVGLPFLLRLRPSLPLSPLFLSFFPWTWLWDGTWDEMRCCIIWWLRFTRSIRCSQGWSQDQNIQICTYLYIWCFRTCTGRRLGKGSVRAMDATIFTSDPEADAMI